MTDVKEIENRREELKIQEDKIDEEKSLRRSMEQKGQQNAEIIKELANTMRATLRVFQKPGEDDSRD